MGVNTWAAFAGTSDDALVVADFAVLENELQPVLKTLCQANINIVAIRQHMIGENPRMIFLHYYGRGKALDLAQGVATLRNRNTYIIFFGLREKMFVRMGTRAPPPLTGSRKIFRRTSGQTVNPRSRKSGNGWRTKVFVATS
jgi:Domain of Unknown Function (DUF1259)